MSLQKSKTIEIPDMLPPYTPTGECVFKRKQYLKQNGVYLIRDAVTGEWLYIGKGACVYRQLYSHFQAYIHRDIFINGTAYKNIAVRKDSVECTIILTKDKELLENMLIKSLNPLLNRRIPKQEYEIEIQEPPTRFMPHLDWVKIENYWNEYLLINGKEPF